MKRITAFVLTLIMLFSMTSCSKVSGVSQNETSSSNDISSETSSDTLSYAGDTPRYDSSLPVLNSEISSSESVSSSSVSSVVSSQAVSSSFVSSVVSSQVQSSSSISPVASSQAISSSQVPSSVVSSQVQSSSSVSTVASSQPASSTPVSSAGYTALNYDEMKAVWLSYLEIPTYLRGKTESQFRSIISEIYSNMVDSGFNTMIMQVRPYSDALYESDYFPWSHVITGTQGAAPDFDPLTVMIEEAHEQGISFHAWINPYRIKTSASTFTLSTDNPAYIWMNGTSAQKNNVLTYNGGYYYNPASTDAQNLIIDGACELVEYYDVDGIHFDDYFYPTTASSFDSVSYTQYKNNGGTLSLDNFRRENVNNLVNNVYSNIKELNSTVVFGISPSGNINTNYSVYYADIAKWCSSTEYLDYICPQIYWGFNHVSAPFAATANSWNSLVTNKNIDLIIGLAAYKIGAAESYSSSVGKYEWQTDSEILSRMVTYARTLSRYSGIAVYKYDSLFNPASSVKTQAQNELAALEEVLFD